MFGIAQCPNLIDREIRCTSTPSTYQWSGRAINMKGACTYGLSVRSWSHFNTWVSFTSYENRWFIAFIIQVAWYEIIIWNVYSTISRGFCKYSKYSIVGGNRRRSARSDRMFRICGTPGQFQSPRRRYRTKTIDFEAFSSTSVQITTLRRYLYSKVHVRVGPVLA